MSRKPALDDAEKRRAYEVYKTGANDDVIALKLGCSTDQVKRWRAATGLPEGGTSAPKPEEPKSSPVVVIKPAEKETKEPEAPKPEQEEPQRVRTIFDFASELAAELSIKELKILLSTMRAYVAEVEYDDD